jgi:dTDP-L-rhamnose 4-epimerase
LVQQPDLRKEEDLKKGIWEPLCKKCKSNLKPIPTNEEAKLKSPSVYAITKKNQEELILSIGRAYRIPAVSVRFFNVYGPRQSLSNPYTGVTAIFMSRVKNNKSPLINEDGLQSRDFISVRDIVRVCHLALEREKANYEIFHVGSGYPITILKVAQTIISLTDNKVKPTITYKYRRGDVRQCFADTQKIRRLLDWRPQVKFAQGMMELFEWSKNETAIDQVDKAVRELKFRGLQ